MVSDRVRIILSGGTAEERNRIRQRLTAENDLRAAVEPDSVSESMDSSTADAGAADQEVEQQARAESARRLRELANSLPAFISFIDAQEHYGFVNQAYVDSFGQPASEMVGHHVRDVLGEANYENIKGHLHQALDGTHVRADEDAFVGEAGPRQLDVSYVPQRREDGSVAGCFVLGLDVTDRKKTERALVEAHELLEAMTDTIPDPIFAKNSQGQMLLANRACLDVIGKPPGAVMGRNEHEWLTDEPEHAQTIIKNDQLVMSSRQPQVVEEWMNTPEGTRLFRGTKAPLINADGQVVGLVGISRDITEERRKAKALEQSEQRLREADERKNEFLAMLGHELRNPLAAVRNATELIKAYAEENPRLRRPQDILERQTSQMAKLLDGLLDVSRIVRGRITLDPKLLNLNEVCNQLVSDSADTAAERQLRLEAEIPREPLWVNADPVRLAQIVDNLLSNSLRYTPADGTVTLKLRRDGESAVIEVRDTGVGIDPELLPHIFEIFRQSKQNLDRSYGGLGLGLSLVRALAELHGGSVDAHSPGPNAGAVFSVRLPLVPTDTSHTTKETAAPQAPDDLNILLIEDNEDAAEMLSEILRLQGHQVTTASQGNQGVQLARELRPDVVLCDLGLPGGMSGFDVARQLRGNERTHNLRIVALSGYGSPEDRADGEQAGFDAHLTKPVDVTHLKRIFAELRVAAT